MNKMVKHIILQVILMIGAVWGGPAFAEETHSSHEHNYVGSVYNNGPVLTLSEAIERAINSSLRMKSVTSRFNASKGAEEQSGSWLNPEIGFEAENIAGSGQFSGTDSAEYTYEISLKVEIGGKRAARKNAAQALRKAVSKEVLAEKLNLERDVYIAYSEVLAEAESVKLAHDQKQLAKGVLIIVSKRVEAAAELEIQQSKAEVAYATSIIALEQKEQQLRVAKEKLARLWGASKLDVSLDHAHFFDLQAPALYSYQEKLQRIPDIQRLTYLKEEKESLLNLERAMVIPDPDFSLGVRDFRESGDQAFLFSVSLPIPVFNQNRGNIAKARAEVVQAISDARQAELMLEQELIKNWQQWNTSFSEAKRLKTKLLPAAEKAFQLSRDGYEKGKFSYLEVLDAQRTLFNARAQFHSALKRYHRSRANVKRLTANIGGE